MKLAYIDSCIWITRFEGLSAYKNRIMQELKYLTHSGWTFCTSEVVWLEVLAKPMQQEQDEIVWKYRNFLAALNMLQHPPDVFKHALTIAHTEQLKALDAVHVAIAAHHNCALFVSSDPHFQSLTTLTPHWVQL